MKKKSFLKRLLNIPDKKIIVPISPELRQKRKEAGRKGGMATYASKGREHYSEIGKRGGERLRKKVKRR